MSRYNTSCLLGPRSRVSVKNNSDVTTVDGSLPISRPVSRNMKHLLGEFKELYEERLRRIDFDTEGGAEEDTLRMKVHVLQAYVNDLGEQNEVLVQTVVGLEEEANDKVVSLEVKLRTADEINAGLDEQRRILEASVRDLRSENRDLRSDLSFLGNRVQESSRTCSRDVSKTELRTVTLKELIGPTSAHICDPADGTRPDLEELTAQLGRKERLIHRLEGELRTAQQQLRGATQSDALVSLQRQVSALEGLQREKVVQVTERDIAIAKLHTQITLLQQEAAGTHTLLAEQKDRMKDLQEDKKKMEEALKKRDEEQKTREEERKRGEEERKREEEERRREEEEERKREEEERRREEEELREREAERRRREEEERRERQNRTAGELREKAAILNAEVERSREQVERQQREILELQRKEETALSELQAQEQRLSEAQKEVRLRGEEMLRLQARLEELQDSHTLTTHQAVEEAAAAWRSGWGAAYEGRLAEAQERTRLLRDDMSALLEKHTATQEQVCALEQVVAEQAEQLNQAERRYQECMEDSGRLRARLEAHTLTALRQQEMLTSQLHDRDAQLEEAAQQARSSWLKVNERGERLKQLLQDLGFLTATQESLRRTLSVTEQHTHQLEGDNTHLRETLALLQDKLQDGVERVSAVGGELERVRAQLSEETILREQLQSQLVQRAQDLERLLQQLRDTSRAAGKKIRKREARLSAAVKELAGYKKQLSDCQEELLSRQCVVERLQEDTAHVRSKMEERSGECSTLCRDRERLETELALTNEKHRTAQQEVESRDQLIIQLQTKLRTAEEKHQGVQEELTLLEAEVSRLNHKVKGHQEEVFRLWEKVREGEGLRDQEERERLQLQNQLGASQLQMKSQAQSIDQLNTDLEAVKQAHRTDTERWAQRNFLIHSQLEQVGCELSQSQAGVREQGLEVKGLTERLNQAEAGLQEAMDKAEVSEGSLRKREAEIDLLRQQLTCAREDLRESTSKARGLEETAAIFKQKYSVAMEKVQQLQRQIESLEEDLRYAQQQLSEAKSEVGGAKAELAELEGRYQEKLGQWESSEEALEQLTDELQSSQSALRESQERLSQSAGLRAALQQQLDNLTQRMAEGESALKSYQKDHSFSDEEHSSLLRQKQLLQRRCTEQVERLAECERMLLQMRSESIHKEEELERRSQEKAGLERTLQSVHLDTEASQRAHLAKHTLLEQEVTRLQQEVTRLGQALARAHTQREQEVWEREALLQRSEEDLKETREVLERRSRELKEQEEEVQRKERERMEEERERKEKQQENQTHVTQLKEEIVELRKKHRDAVEELVARGEEVAGLEGCVREGRLCEEERRLAVERLDREAQELRQLLHQATKDTISAQNDRNNTQQQLQEREAELAELREKHRALQAHFLEAEAHGKAWALSLEASETWMEQREEELDTLRSELEGARSDNTQLRQESQLVMTNVNHWIQEQRVSSESLAAQIRAQNKVLVIIAEEKEHLQEANDSLKEEMEREMEQLKIHAQDRASKQHEDNMERESCVVHNLSRLQDMQARLRTNLEAIALLNDHLSALGVENEDLRRQLEEERARRRRAERLTLPPLLLPLPLSAHPLLLSTSFHPPLSPSPGPGEECDGALTRAELSAGGPPAPGETQAVGEAH